MCHPRVLRSTRIDHRDRTRHRRSDPDAGGEKHTPRGNVDHWRRSSTTDHRDERAVCRWEDEPCIAGHRPDTDHRRPELSPVDQTRSRPAFSRTTSRWAYPPTALRQALSTASQPASRFDDPTRVDDHDPDASAVDGRERVVLIRSESLRGSPLRAAIAPGRCRVEPSNEAILRVTRVRCVQRRRSRRRSAPNRDRQRLVGVQGRARHEAHPRPSSSERASPLQLPGAR